MTCVCMECGSVWEEKDLETVVLDTGDEFAACPECGCSSFDLIPDRPSRGERNKKNWAKAIRKRNLVVSWPCFKEGYYNNLHQYMKNKIHCSCPMCRAKTSKKKMRKAVGPGGKNWDLADKKRIDEMKDELLEFQVVTNDQEVGNDWKENN